MNRGNSFSNGAGNSSYNGAGNSMSGGGGPTSLLIDGSRLQEHWWLLV